MIDNDYFQVVLLTGLSLDHFSLLNWYVDYREVMVLVRELTRSSRQGSSTSHWQKKKGFHGYVV
tara:strand:- start:781 stop:972 length:192 start_codon:yes stop_codon:yes gene_type:complete